MNKKIQLSILSIFIAAALVGSVATYGDNMAFAGGDKDKKDKHDGDKHDRDQYKGDKNKKKSNEATQDIAQFSGTAQDSVCDSGNNTLASCNNVALSFNLNDGNNALGQQ
ncbi:hypothetical protein BH23THE1_BH23THE1_31490 [soil metagenome]